MPEMIDLYDIHRNPAGETISRGETLPLGRYRLGVQVWLQNDSGLFLLTQRHPRKKKGLLWEPTGGAVIAGEDTLSAGIRELREEIGVVIAPSALRLLRTALHNGNEFLDTYIARWNGSVGELALQSDEVVDARWVSADELRQMDAAELLASEWQYLIYEVNSHAQQ